MTIPIEAEFEAEKAAAKARIENRAAAAKRSNDYKQFLKRMENNIVVVDNPWRSVRYEDMPVGESFIIHEKGDEKFVFCKCQIDKVAPKKYRYVVEKALKATRYFGDLEEVVKHFDYWLPYFSLPCPMSNADREKAAEKAVSIQVRKKLFESLESMEDTKVVVTGSEANQKKLLSKKTGEVKKLERITFQCRDCDPDAKITFKLKDMELAKMDGAMVFLINLGKILCLSRD